MISITFSPVLFLLFFSLFSGQEPAKRSDKEDLAQVRFHTELVTMTVKVTDNHGRCVTGLEKDSFEIYDNDVKKSIDFFSMNDSSVSVGFLVDVSNSMDLESINESFAAIRRFLAACRDGDEYFLLLFNSRSELLVDFTPCSKGLSIDTAKLIPEGSTALYDAVYLAENKMAKRKNRRRALLIFSDGKENDSSYSFKDVSRLTKEADIQIYGIGGYTRGQRILRELAEPTGGHSYSLKSIEETIDKINLELRQEYSIGFTPEAEAGQTSHDNWHKLKVRLSPDKNLSHLKLNSRSGYYSTALQ